MSARLTYEEKMQVAELLGADDRPLKRMNELDKRIDYISGTERDSRLEEQE